MNDDYITKSDAISLACEAADEWDGGPNKCRSEYIRDAIEGASPADVRPVPPGGIGEMSDGYHTFNGLYYQRMVLFAALVKVHRVRAWKSRRHSDGELCFGGGWFIVGIDTPEGRYTYHYEDKYWDMFVCQVLVVGLPWDGHTEDDVTRLLSLPDVRHMVRGEWIETGCFDQDYQPIYECSHCHREVADNFIAKHLFCLHCGAEMREAST